jgi:hypothetical protein
MLITESWLKEAGFRWHEVINDPSRHWLLWIGHAIDGSALSSSEDLGLELAEFTPGSGNWHCWFRADTARRYSRFIHIRHVSKTAQLTALIEGITGHPFDPKDALYGALHSPEVAARLRAQENRLDRVVMREVPWSEVEQDTTRGGALPGHLEYFVDTRQNEKEEREAAAERENR